MTGKHVAAVLMGGFSSERSVSLSSGVACATTLEECGYRVTRIDVDRNVASILVELKPDVVFNALHGPFGEDGAIQGVLEYLQIPYTHSGVLASALAMDKDRAKKVAAAAGVVVAPSRLMNRFDIGSQHPMKPPYVVKPVREGSSFGVVIVKEDQPHPPQVIGSADWKYGDEVMVEGYIAGRELTCAVMGIAPWMCARSFRSVISSTTMIQNMLQVHQLTCPRQKFYQIFTKNTNNGPYGASGNRVSGRKPVGLPFR